MKHDADDNSRLVYSTEWGAVDRAGAKRKTKAKKRIPPSGPPGDGVVRVSKQTKGRKGAGVTLITGVPLASADLAVLAKELKRACGSGGTVKSGVIEIQGEHRDRLVELLGDKGWTVKKAGG